eukprot:353922-Chlamydomonas_euryale.AAC.1
MPLRTFPPSAVARGAEAALANGFGSVEFVAGVMELAGLLGGADPRVGVEVWHQEATAADTLLGVASVPLSPLMQEGRGHVRVHVTFL